MNRQNHPTSSEPIVDQTTPTSWMEGMGLLLRKHEQLALFVILVICGVILGGYFLQLHWMHGRLIDIDEITYQPVEYLVDLNQADWPELANIPNIGEKLSKAIIEFRSQHGEFESIEQLNKVPGIGPAKLSLLREHLIPINPALSTDSSFEFGNQ